MKNNFSKSGGDLLHQKNVRIEKHQKESTVEYYVHPDNEDLLGNVEVGLIITQLQNKKYQAQTTAEMFKCDESQLAENITTRIKEV